MVSFSASSMFFHEYGIDEIFSMISSTGLDGIEFWMETPDFWLRGQPVDELIGSWSSNPKIQSLTLHASVLDLNPCSINPEVAHLSIDYALRSIRIAGQIGAGIVTVHPGRRTAKRPPGAADFERFSRYLDSLREAAKRSPVRIAMENMEPAVNSLISTPEQMRDLLDDQPWLMFTFDVAHAMMNGDAEPARYIELCHDRLVNVHISRVVNRKLHFPLDFDPVMAGVIEALSKRRYSGPLTLEIEDLNFDHALTREEKTNVLSRDCTFMRACMR